MRSLLIVFVLFAAGLFLGHEYWPQSHPDPAWHFRFHRGKMPPFATETQGTNNPPPAQHGRILHPQN